VTPKWAQRDLERYFAAFDEPPLPWVQRRTNYWHLADGIRKDTGNVQTHCMIGSGPGPFKWREKPTLDWRDEPGEWFCARCLAAWTRGVDDVTVRVDGVKVTKGQLTRLLNEIEGTDLLEIELRPTNVEDAPALLAIVTREEQRDSYTERWLVAGNGVVKL
jgi:hypothetical protein